MRQLFSTFFILLSLPLANAQTYKPVDEGSKIHFVIKNFGIKTGGALSGLKGLITFDPLNLATAEFAVTADVKTIDTDSENRDEHLRSESYFDVEKFPVILIKSTKISTTNKTKNGWYFFTGSLTIHGITKEFSFPFTATPRGNDYLFSGSFDLNRLDYSVGEPSSVLSKSVKVFLTVLAKKS